MIDNDTAAVADLPGARAAAESGGRTRQWYLVGGLNIN
jgi:hypothetical protein